MISVTNDPKTFFEKEQGEIIIYGAGNAGYWTSFFMDKCCISHSFFLDKNATEKKATLNGHPIFPVEKLKEYKKKHIRLVASLKAYKEVLADLLWLDHLWGLDISCIIPQYKDLICGDDRYNINRFLGYFRRKLLKDDFPTIICNTCIGGRIYEAFDMPTVSPFINLMISPPDYLKICKDLHHYMEEELVVLNWERVVSLSGAPEYLLCKLGDVSIYFGHISSEEGVVERWNIMKDRINWFRIIYIMEEQANRKSIPMECIEDFMKIKGKKLFVKGTSFYETLNQKPLFLQYEDMPNRREPAIENYFDIVDWMNKDDIGET